MNKKQTIRTLGSIENKQPKQSKQPKQPKQPKKSNKVIENYIKSLEVVLKSKKSL